MRMDDRLVWLVGPIIAVGAALGLRNSCRRVYRSLGCSLVLMTSALALRMLREPGPPGNSPLALATFLVALPMLATLEIERFWLVLGKAHPFGRAILAVPLGILTYVFAFVVSLTIAVNVGALWP